MIFFLLHLSLFVFISGFLNIFIFPVKWRITVLRDSHSRLNQFPTIADTKIKKIIISFLFKMDEILSKICKYFPSVSENVLRKIYAGRCERLRLLMQKGIPEDIVL